LLLKYSSGIAGGAEPIPDGLSNAEEMKHRRQMERGERVVVTPPRWKLQDVLARGVADVKVPMR